jgi:hypothetical protein
MGTGTIIRDEMIFYKFCFFQYFSNRFETKNGVKAAEAGSIVDRGTADESLRSEGYYQFTADDGIVYRVDYVAVANGYVNAGQPLPKSQSAIIRALEYISKNPNVQW